MKTVLIASQNFFPLLFIRFIISLGQIYYNRLDLMVNLNFIKIDKDYPKIISQFLLLNHDLQLLFLLPYKFLLKNKTILIIKQYLY